MIYIGLIQVLGMYLQKHSLDDSGFLEEALKWFKMSYEAGEELAKKFVDELRRKRREGEKRV